MLIGIESCHRRYDTLYGKADLIDVSTHATGP